MSSINLLSDDFTWPDLGNNNPTLSNENTPTTKPFRFNCSSFGLTYSQSNLDIKSLHANLLVLLHSHTIQHLVIGREQHQNGGTHYHVGIKLTTPLCTRNVRFWDQCGEHPNIIRCRNYPNWVSYCKKCGDTLETGSIHASRRSPISEQTVVDNATKLSKLNFLIWAGVNKVHYAEKIWDLANTSTLITIKENQIIEGTMNVCLQQLKFSLDWLGPKALILVGESGVGKTTWAKTNIPKPALFVTHIDELRQFKPHYHKSILFDDVSFTHYPIQAQIHLVDFFDPRSIHVRYGIATIPAKTTKIFTCNENPVDLTHPAIKRRCHVITITGLPNNDN